MLQHPEALAAFGRAGVVVLHARGSAGLFTVANVRDLKPRAAFDVVLYVPERDEQQRADVWRAVVDGLSRWRLHAQGGWFNVPVEQRKAFVTAALDAIGTRLAAPGDAFTHVEKARRIKTADGAWTCTESALGTARSPAVVVAA